MWPLLVICDQLRSVDNLGAIARVMANFGFEELVLSNPVTHDFRGADRLGVKADPVLGRMAVAMSLQEALQSCVFAVGTTSRSSVKRRRVMAPEEGVELLRAHGQRGKVALVLGGEKRGLSDVELELCQEIIAVPTPGPQPSMNIAQAASVLLYLASRAGAPSHPTPSGEGAKLELIATLERRMEDVLLAAEFLNPQAPGHVLHELTRSLTRGHLTGREAQLWLSAFEHLKRAQRC